MTVSLSVLAGAGAQFLDDNGDSLSGGLLYTYAAGTSTPVVAYTDSGGGTPHANPIVLDSAGRPSSGGSPTEVWLTDTTSYKFVLKTSAGATIWTADNITGAFAAQTYDTFVALLAGTTGAGLVGFSTGETYPAATVGETLKAIAGGDGFDSIIVGDGVKGLPQTNVAVQVHRDITAVSPSYHGFNDGDYFGADGNALNPFGADIRIGDGTQTGGFALGHVNDFQATDITNLGGGLNALHTPFLSQPVLLSGTISRTTHFNAIDQLGARDTPGFGVAGFEVDGTATQNNQTGLGITIRHGTNPKSIHVRAGNDDAGALLTSGAAMSDFEGQIVNRQATDSTSKGTGALLLTAGGIGCFGSVFAGTEVSSSGSAPQVTVRSAANTLMGRMTHDGTTMRVRGETGTVLKLGTGAADLVDVKSDRMTPTTDDTLYCGDATHRWKQLYAVTATIGTSDERTKQNIRPIDDALLDAWGDVHPVLFQFNSAVELKGDKARHHAGYVAQNVRDVLASHGIDGFEYALLCEDDLTEEVTEYRTVEVPRMESVEVEVESFNLVDGVLVRTMETKTEERPVTQRMQVYNEDGTEYLADLTADDGSPIKVLIAKDMPVTDEMQEPFTHAVKTGETRLGLRYQHCLVVECAYLRREVNRMTLDCETP